MKNTCCKLVAWLLVICSAFTLVPVSLAEGGGIPLLDQPLESSDDGVAWTPVFYNAQPIANDTAGGIPLLSEMDEEAKNGSVSLPQLPTNNEGGIPLFMDTQTDTIGESVPVLSTPVQEQISTELGIGEINDKGQYNRQYTNEEKVTVTAAQLLKLIQDGDEVSSQLAKQLGFGYRKEDQIANLTKLVDEYALFPDFIEPGFEIDDVSIKVDKEITEDTEDGLSGYRTTVNVETTAAITIQYDERGETKIVRRVPSANPTDFVITLDVSGSMRSDGRGTAMFSALETLLGEIFEDPKNTASVIFWSDNADVMRLDINEDGIIESTFSSEHGITVSQMYKAPLLDANGNPDYYKTNLDSYKDKSDYYYDVIINRIEDMYNFGGGTEPDLGLQQAIDLLDAMNRADERNLGVLLFTDGEANYYSSEQRTVELEKKLAEDYYAKVVNVSIGDERQVEAYRRYLDPTSNNYRGGDDAVLQNRVVYYNIPNLTDEELAARVTAMFDTAFEEFTSEKVELKTETVTAGIMAAVNAKLIETIPAGFEVHSTDGHTYTVDGLDENGNTIIIFQLDDLMAGQNQSVSYFTVPVSADKDLGLTAYTENANTVLVAEPVDHIAQPAENRKVEIIYKTVSEPKAPTKYEVTFVDLPEIIPFGKALTVSWEGTPGIDHYEFAARYVGDSKQLVPGINVKTATSYTIETPILHGEILRLWVAGFDKNGNKLDQDMVEISTGEHEYDEHSIWGTKTGTETTKYEDIGDDNIHRVYKEGIYDVLCKICHKHVFEEMKIEVHDEPHNYSITQDRHPEMNSIDENSHSVEIIIKTTKVCNNCGHTVVTQEKYSMGKKNHNFDDNGNCLDCGYRKTILLTIDEFEKMMEPNYRDTWTQKGKIRYVMQGEWAQSDKIASNNTVDYTYWGDYVKGVKWTDNDGNVHTEKSTSMCNRGTASMALSYIGYDVKPVDFKNGSTDVELQSGMLGKKGIRIVTCGYEDTKNGKRITSNCQKSYFDKLYVDFSKDYGVYNLSPVIIYTKYKNGGSSHWIAVVGQDKDAPEWYWVIDPAGGVYSQIKLGETDDGCLMIESYRFKTSKDQKNWNTTDYPASNYHGNEEKEFVLKIMQYQHIENDN